MLRRWRRAVALAFTFGMCLPRFWWKRLRGPLSLEERARWLQSVARAALQNLEVEVRMEGEPAGARPAGCKPPELSRLRLYSAR